jgi:hypothetical protein
MQLGIEVSVDTVSNRTICKSKPELMQILVEHGLSSERNIPCAVDVFGQGNACQTRKILLLAIGTIDN